MRVFSVLLLALLLAGCAESGGSVGGASSSLRRFVYADPATGCQARRLHDALPADAVRWTGGCAGGFVSGEGTLTWMLAGEVVETDRGSQKNGLLEGEATRLLSDGARYSGHWRAGKREGQGAQLWPDGATYEGQWKNDRVEGLGAMTSAAGQHYEGDWRDGKREGQGVQTWPSGTRYEGEWSADERDGRGKFNWPDGSYFVGQWDAGKPISKGSLFVDSNGARYLNWDYPE